jgi:hypothetical protein
MDNPFKEPGPYQLANDDSGHWYVIPAAREGHWDNWLGGSEWADGLVPMYAEAVGGSPTRVQFTEYQFR